MSKPQTTDSELFRLASLIGCEPEKEERHRKQLLEYIQEHDQQRLAAVLEALESISSPIGDIDINKARQAITAALAPHTTNGVEEKL